MIRTALALIAAVAVAACAPSVKIQPLPKAAVPYGVIIVCPTDTHVAGFTDSIVNDQGHPSERIVLLCSPAK